MFNEVLEVSKEERVAPVVSALFGNIIFGSTPPHFYEMAERVPYHLAVKVFAAEQHSEIFEKCKYRLVQFLMRCAVQYLPGENFTCGKQRTAVKSLRSSRYSWILSCSLATDICPFTSHNVAATSAHVPTATMI